MEQYKTRLKTGNVRRVTDEDALCIDTQKALPRQRMQAKSNCVVGARRSWVGRILCTQDDLALGESGGQSLSGRDEESLGL